MGDRLPPGHRWVPNYEGLYYISEHGRVFSVARTFVRVTRGVTQTVGVPYKEKARLRDKNGYLCVRLFKVGEAKSLFVHRLVCHAFHGPPPFEDAQAAHEDGVPMNCHKDNLSWKSRVENNQDKSRHGTRRFGDKIRVRKICSAQAKEIYQAIVAGHPLCRLAEKYGINSSTISKIKSGKAWADATADLRGASNA